MMWILLIVIVLLFTYVSLEAREDEEDILKKIRRK
jgi:protein-S-isoprenylcysteine O-methyltransferase Ste14